MTALDDLERFVARLGLVHVHWTDLLIGLQRGNLPPPRVLYWNIVPVLLWTERIWARVPIVIASAYRTPDYNARVGGAKRSEHTQFRALDLHPAGRYTTEALHEAAYETRPTGRTSGLGYYAWGVHIDCRSAERSATWGAKQTAPAKRTAPAKQTAPAKPR